MKESTMFKVTQAIQSMIVMGLLVSTSVLANTSQSIEVKVNGLVCAFCAQGITKAFQSNDATDEVWVSLENQLVAIALKQDQDISDDEVTSTLTDAGYDVVSIERTDRTLAMIQAGVDGDDSSMGEMMHGNDHDDHHGSDHDHTDHHRPDNTRGE
jgi:copper chaperone CopZ